MLGTLGKTVLSGSRLNSGSSWLRESTSLPIGNVFCILHVAMQNFTISCENALEENIEKENLKNHIEQVQELTNGKLEMRDKFFPLDAVVYLDKIVPALSEIEPILGDEIILHFPNSNLSLLLLYQSCRGCKTESRNKD